MQLKTFYLTLKTNKFVEEDPSKLRGYIANNFKEYPILHHHIQNGYFYNYPKVQYKIIEGTPLILGIDEGAIILHKIYPEINELLIGNKKYIVLEKKITELNSEIKCITQNIQYSFITPWIGLNSENYKNYVNITDWKEKKSFLNNIIIGNILSMSKGLELVIDNTLYVHSHLEQAKIYYKGVPFIAFTGKFKINFEIPNFFGLGKGVSQGFGTVFQLNSN